MQGCAVSDRDVVSDDCGLGLAAAGNAVLGNVHNHVVLDVGLVANLDTIDVTCAWMDAQTKPAGRLGRICAGFMALHKICVLWLLDSPTASTLLNHHLMQSHKCPAQIVPTYKWCVISPDVICHQACVGTGQSIGTTKL
jgi:hypothetical protein